MSNVLYAVFMHDDDEATVIYADSLEGPWHEMVTGHPDHCWEIVNALKLAQRPTFANDPPTLESRLHHAAIDSMMWDKTVGEAIDQALAEMARLRLENTDLHNRIRYLSEEEIRNGK
ncbi:MAG TPA: hypothetical protein VIG24_01305 [Acidimicrobiia bacterium]